ncbi:hypothetical protein KC19_2G178900 [Ceratodon purpureus]|uniref:Uncharacterized protein n=1 Tax=Ceratodon purpureus TaxID=3225 RepID=A0A8T0IY02_CERPU|nr:hypothetical protein KC19_2G178900 [Ceratodon purpureus]
MSFCLFTWMLRGLLPPWSAQEGDCPDLSAASLDGPSLPPQETVFSIISQFFC